LPIPDKAGGYFDRWRTIATGLDPLQGFDSEFALLTKLPPRNQRVVHLVVHSRNSPVDRNAIQGAIRM
jgi:hypothetical protein